MKRDGHVLLYTSGVDSYVALRYLTLKKAIKHTLTAYVDLHNRYSQEEIRYIKKTDPSCIIISDTLNLKDYEEEKTGFIPNRNMLLLSIVSAWFYQRFDRLYLYTGSNKDDRISDQSIKFYNLASKLLSLSLDKKIYVKSAFDFKLTKRQVVNWMVDNYESDPDEIVQDTFSCYSPINGSPCMSCKACFRRNVSLQDVKVLDFHNPEIISYYKDEIKKGKIIGSRKKDIQEYFEKIGV